MAFKVTGLDHIVLRCADVEASIDFYCGALGLEPERLEQWRRGEVPFPSVRVDTTTIIDLFEGSSDGSNLDHLCLVFEGDDLDAVAARFPDGRRADHLFGAQGSASSLYVHDPDGTTVELRYYDALPTID